METVVPALVRLKAAIATATKTKMDSDLSATAPDSVGMVCDTILKAVMTVTLTVVMVAAQTVLLKLDVTVCQTLLVICQFVPSATFHRDVVMVLWMPLKTVMTITHEAAMVAAAHALLKEIALVLHLVGCLRANALHPTHVVTESKLHMRGVTMEIKLAGTAAP
jgi:hypothetical protein